MRMMVLMGLLAGCQSEQGWQGTSVGNPGDVTPKAALGADVTHRTGSLTVDTVALVGCDGSTAAESIDAAVDIIGGEPLVLPPGTWCSLRLLTDGLLLEGTDDGSGHTYTVSLAVQQIVLTSAAGVAVDDSRYLLELGTPGWLDSATLGLADGDVTIAPGHPLYDSLLADVEQGSILYADDDEDGELDDDERDRPLAGDEDEDEVEEDTEDEEGG